MSQRGANGVRTQRGSNAFGFNLHLALECGVPLLQEVLDDEQGFHLDRSAIILKPLEKLLH